MSVTKIVHHGRDDGDDEGTALGVADVEEESLNWVVAFPFGKWVWEGSCDVNRHSTHPKEEPNKSMLDDVTKKDTETCVQQVFISIQIQAVMNANKKVADEDIEEESNGNLPK